MKKIVIGLGLGSALLLGACGGDIDEKNNRPVTSQEEKKEEVADNKVEKKEQKEKALGVRSNPLPLGDTITTKVAIYDDSFNSYAANLDLKIASITRGEEAWQQILAENQFNSEPDEGMEYVLVKVEALLKDAETEDDSYNLSSYSFKTVSADGKEYPHVMVVVPSGLDAKLYNGGATEGHVIGQVRVGEDFFLSFNGTEGSPVFFQAK